MPAHPCFPVRARAAVVLAVLGALLQPVVEATPASAAPGRLITAHAWGVVATSADDQTVNTLQRRMGKTFASYHVYAMLDEAYKFPNAAVQSAMRANELIYLNINSAHGDTQHRQPYCWIDIINGVEDGLIDGWSNAINATYYNNIVISFQHEQSITSSVQPKCSTDTPSRYGRAYDHVVNRMRSAGVQVPFAWVSTAGAFATGVANQYAPPAADFSVVGVDAYSGEGRTWRSASYVLTPFFEWQATNAPDKQLIIAQLGVIETDSRAPGWCGDAITLMKQHPNLLAVGWNVANDSATGRLYSPLLNRQTLKIWLAGAADPFFN